MNSCMLRALSSVIVVLTYVDSATGNIFIFDIFFRSFFLISLFGGVMPNVRYPRDADVLK